MSMKSSRDRQPSCLESLDQSLIKSVVQKYVGCKANGHGEMAARNAAILVLREALPSWDFRAASDMVSRIIAGSGPAAQPA